MGHAWGALRAGGVSLRGFLLGYGFQGLSGSGAWHGCRFKLNVGSRRTPLSR